jgi:hypothetical protein
MFVLGSARSREPQTTNLDGKILMDRMVDVGSILHRDTMSGKSRGPSFRGLEHSRRSISDENRACDCVGLRQHICCLNGGLNRRNYHTCDCAGRNSRVKRLHNRRSRLC